MVKATSLLKWIEQIGDDCNRVWKVVKCQRKYAEKVWPSDLKFVEAHPMESFEESIQFSLVR
jgi:hypothetical protein